MAGRLLRLAQARQAHPARMVVLLPYAQLMPLARAAWAQHVPDGFAPRFETTRNWAQQSAFEPQDGDIAFDRGRDLLTARSLLETAGLAARAESLAPRVVEAALQLAPLAAAARPSERASWAAKARAAVQQGMDAPVLQLEALVARVAVEWAAASAYASDSLLAEGTIAPLDLLVVLEGLQHDPLQASLLRLAGDKGVSLPLAADAPRGSIALHAARDAADEAERAAACVLRHIEAGRTPVALAATDRVLTRRVAALLAQAGAGMRDEQGWKLSTTRSAAQLMALLRACAWDAGSDAVLDWLKHVPAAGTGGVLGLERIVRRNGLREWRFLRPTDCGDSESLQGLLARVNAWRESLYAPRSLQEWLAGLEAVLNDGGQLARLRQDDAGMQVLEALRIGAGEADDLSRLPLARRPMDLMAFRGWVDEVLEADSFRRAPRADAPVVILPFEAMLGRPFAAVVLPGCDEQRMPASPEPAGAWTPAQRRALGLPSREEGEAALRAAWQQALQSPQGDVLWRTSDDNGEPLLASPLVQLLVQEAAPLAEDPREVREVPAAPTARPQPVAPQLPVQPLSASAYEDLRRCPYRYFAMRQLRLSEAEEVESEVDKRDFGNWLHGVLRQFHETIQREGEPAAGRQALMDAAAQEQLSKLRLEEDEFLPFRAGWPGVRDAYLEWLAKHEAGGARFVQAEGDHEAGLGEVRLFGRIDRIDETPAGRLLIDYKTEGTQATRDRMQEPLEDTQLAFYAALLGQEEVQASYLNISERGKVTPVAHPEVLRGRELMQAAIVSEMRRIASGEALPALGEGKACEFCKARGLCRKDFWQ